jgi:hypothetical protein
MNIMNIKNVFGKIFGKAGVEITRVTSGEAHDFSRG